VLELRYSPAELDDLHRRPELRDAVRFGLLVRRIAPLLEGGRPELPVKRSAQQEAEHAKRQIMAGQVAYDQLLALIAVPEGDDAALPELRRRLGMRSES
jgi:hypothetical protein